MAQVEVQMVTRGRGAGIGAVGVQDEVAERLPVLRQLLDQDARQVVGQLVALAGTVERRAGPEFLDAHHRPGPGRTL